MRTRGCLQLRTPAGHLDAGSLREALPFLALPLPFRQRLMPLLAVLQTVCAKDDAANKLAIRGFYAGAGYRPFLAGSVRSAQNPQSS